MGALVDVLDKQQDKVYGMHPKRALYLATAYPTRFRIQDLHQLRKELAEMARLTDKHPVKYQQKITLEDIKGEDVKLVGLEEKEGTSGNYFIMRIERKDGTTGYISMGFTPICDALKQVDPKKELPADIRFEKTGSSWNMV